MIEQEQPTVQPVIARWRNIAMIVAIIGVVLSIVGLVVNPTHFVASYLTAFAYITAFSLLGLGMSMVHYLGGGRWGAAVGDILRAQSSQFWLLGIMFIPIVLLAWGTHFYPWSQPAVYQSDPLIQARGIWLTLPFWTVRSIIYFAIWIPISVYLLRWFRQWDATGDPADRRRLRNLAGGGLAIFILSFSFATFDWFMSMEPDWSSSIYGAMWILGDALCGWAFMIFIFTRFRDLSPIRQMYSRTLVRDLGSLMVAMTILWAYTTFSPFMLVWVGNLTYEIPWYIARITNGWEVVAAIWLTTNFLINFPALVMRGTRKSGAWLGWITVMVMIGRFLETAWLIQPDFPPVPLLGHWIDLAAVMGLGGIWAWFFFRQLGERLVVVRPAAIFPSHHAHPLAPGTAPRPRPAE